MKKVVIIGAGPAGLTCAYELLKKKKDIDIAILEQDDQVGGISKTIVYNGNRMDLGGHRFYSKSRYVNEIWQDILPLEGKKNRDNVLLVRNRVSRIYYQKKFFSYPITISFDTIYKLGFCKTICSGFSYLKSVVFKRKEINLENFYINRFGKKLYEMFFLQYTVKVWGRSPKDISSDWGSQRAKGLSVFEVLKDAFFKILHIKRKKQETSLIESFYYPKYGPGQMWESMAKYLEKNGVKIIKGARVVKIKKTNDNIASVLYIKDSLEKEIKADFFVSSMPIKDLIEAMEDVPLNISSIALNLPYRDFMTVGLVVRNFNLSDEDSKDIPDCWIYVQEENVKMGRIQIFNNWSPYLVKDKNTISLGLEYFCLEGDELWEMSDQEFKDFAVSELVSMGMIRESDVVSYHVERVKKAYPAYFDTYDKIDDVIDYLNIFDNLYCIGRNGQHRYNNMDHSMLTGVFCARDIIFSKGDKNIIWSVNTEREYMEVQNEKKD